MVVYNIGLGENRRLPTKLATTRRGRGLADTARSVTRGEERGETEEKYISSSEGAAGMTPRAATHGRSFFVPTLRRR